MSIKTKEIQALETEIKVAQYEFKTAFASLERLLESMKDRLFSVYIEGVVFTGTSRPKFEKAQREFTESLINFNRLWTETITGAWYHRTALQDRLEYEQDKKGEAVK